MPPPSTPFKLRKMIAAVVTVTLGFVATFALANNVFSRNCSDVGALEGKSALDSGFKSSWKVVKWDNQA